MKDFSVPGNPSDYYVAASDDLAGVKYSAVRSQVRKLAEAYTLYINDVAASGGNPHTASLDLSDKVRAFMSNEPADAQLAFYDVYTQEMNAAAASTIDDTTKLNAEMADKQRSISMSAQWVVALLIFLVAMLFIFS